MNNYAKMKCRLEADGTKHLVILTLVLLGLMPAAAEGFRNSPPGAFNLGRAGGRIAQVDDASAVTQNPANLSSLTNLEFQVSPSGVYMNVDFKSTATGQSSKTENAWKLLPNAFFAIPLKDEDITLGFGLTSPYGLSVDWNDDATSAFAPGTGVFRYSTAYFTELVALNFNPTVSFKLCDQLSLGIGLDVMWSRLTLKQYYPWAAFPGSGGAEPDGILKGQGTGVGYGGNIGLTWKITERQTVAVTYRSQMDVDYDGHVNLNNITPTATLFGVTDRSDFSSSVAFPNIVAIGYGIQITDKLRVESDIEWIQFSRFKSLPLDAGNNNVILPASSRSVPQNWRDTFTLGIGGDYQLTDKWIVRGGYQYYQSPVPDSTFSPTIPDANQNVLTVGLGYHGKHHSLEIAYGLDFYDKRNITSSYQPAFNGTYDVTVHLFSMSYAFSF